MPAPSTPNTVRIDPQFMFSNHKGVHKSRLEKRQRKLLEKIPFISAFLAPDEKLLLVTPCVSPTSIWEQLTTGWIFVYINRALLVVTNKGIFHVPTKTNYSYRHSIAKFRYEDCKQWRMRSSYLFVQYGNGKKEQFLYIPRAQRLKLKAYLQTLTVGEGTVANAGKIHLCPRCTKPLAAGIYQCGSCRLPFKDMATAIKTSLWWPGGGYFYTGHPLLGISDFIVESVLLLFVIMSIIDGKPDSVGNAIFFGVILAFEKFMTIHHAKRYISEYIPKDQPVRLQPAVA
jgi:hypothetical protein